MSEEDFDDLPPIEVLSPGSDCRSGGMPSAGEVARQRESEARCEMALRLLRPSEPGEPSAPSAPSTPSTPSSGSEGEVGLAAAVTALHVQQQRPRRADGALAARLAPRRPHDALLRAALRADTMPPAEARAFVDAVTEHVCAAVACSANTWTAEEALSACSWLLCAPTARRGLAARRALQRLLDGAAPDAAPALATLLRTAAEPLQLADALRSGAGGGADGAAVALATDALEQLAAQDGLDAGARYAAVQAAGRLLAARRDGADGADGALLAHVQRATAGLDRHRPEHLKVLVAASKLQLLFRAAH